MGWHLWGRTESDTTEVTWQQQQQIILIPKTVLRLFLKPLSQSEEDLKILLKKGKEESEKPGLKINIEETKIMVSSPISSWQIDGRTMETVTDYLGEHQNHCRW